MAEFRINKVLFKIINPKIKLWVSANQLPSFHRKRTSLFSEIVLPDHLRATETIFFSFQPNQEAIEIEVNLEKTKYFLKPYVDFQLIQFFHKKQLPIRQDFIQSVQIWKHLTQDAKVSTYDRFSLRQVSASNIHRLELLISYDGKSLSTRRPLSESNLQSPFSKYFMGNEIFESRTNPVTDRTSAFPILSIPMKKEMGIPFEGFANKNTYLEYYKKISEFYDTYLKNQTVGENIIFYSDSFERVDEQKIMKTKKVSNSLRFNNNSDFNIFSGLKNYGPYKVPSTENLRFIFIYKPYHRDSANQLYLAFKNGYANNFPGLKDYIKIHFELAEENKILLQTDNPNQELKGKLEQYPFQAGLRYFAIYLTDHKRFETIDDDNDEDRKSVV